MMKITALEKLCLKYRFPFFLCLTAAITLLVGVNQWLEYQYWNAEYPIWIVKDIIAGDTLTVTSDLDSENRTIKLCGIIPAHHESKDFLKSVVDRGDGSINLEQVGKFHEAWVMLKPDFEQQIHLNTYMVENGMARHDTENSQNCRSNYELSLAQNIAQEEKLGIWSSSEYSPFY